MTAGAAWAVARKTRAAWRAAAISYGILRVTDAVDFERPPSASSLTAVSITAFNINSPTVAIGPPIYFMAPQRRGDDLNALPRQRSIGLVGLGTGTLAAWGKPGDTIRLYRQSRT